MSTEQNKETARRYYEDVLNKGDLDALDELAVSNYQENDPLPGQRSGLDGLKDRVSILRGGLTSTYTIEDIIAEGDRVVVRWTNSGTHTGEFLGIPPTNKEFSFGGADIHRFEDGKMAEHWHVVDQLALLTQLGLVPPPGPPPG